MRADVQLRLALLRHPNHERIAATEVGDGAVPALGRLAKLEELQVWQSAVSEDGIAKLRAALPRARITGAPVLPPPAPPVQGGARRRR